PASPPPHPPPPEPVSEPPQPRANITTRAHRAGPHVDAITGSRPRNMPPGRRRCPADGAVADGARREVRRRRGRPAHGARPAVVRPDEAARRTPRRTPHTNRPGATLRDAHPTRQDACRRALRPDGSRARPG